MSATLVDIAAAIAAELDAAALSVEFTPQWSFADWDLELKDLDTLSVDVVPVNFTEEQETQGSWLVTCTVDIGVRKRFDARQQVAATGRNARDEISTLVDLLQQIAEFWMPAQPDYSGRKLADIPLATWQETKIKTAHVPRHLREMRQYTGIVQVVYEVEKPP